MNDPGIPFSLYLSIYSSILDVCGNFGVFDRRSLIGSGGKWRFDCR